MYRKPVITPWFCAVHTHVLLTRVLGEDTMHCTACRRELWDDLRRSAGGKPPQRIDDHLLGLPCSGLRLRYVTMRFQREAAPG